MNCRIDVNSYVHKNIKNAVGNVGIIDLHSGVGMVNKEFGKKNLDIIQNLNNSFGEEVITYTSPRDTNLPGSLNIKLSDKLYDYYLDRYGEKSQEAIQNKVGVKQPDPLNEQFNTSLKDSLLKFFDKLNIRVEFNQDELLQNLDFNNKPLSAFDSLQKFLALGNNITNKDFLKQSANILYTFLGKKSELSITLWKSVENWKGYKEVYNKYKDNLQNVSEDIEYSQKNFNPFAHRQAIIYFLTEILEEGIDNDFNPLNLENPDINKDYFNDKGYKNKYEKNILKLTYNKVWNWVQKNILGNKIEFEITSARLRDMAMDIVNDVYKGDFKKYIREYIEDDEGIVRNIKTGEEYNQKYYQDTLDKDPFAKSIIERLFNNPFVDYKLSGSQVVRKYGRLLRAVSEDLHDIDGVITLDQFRTEENSFKFYNWLKTRGLKLNAQRKSSQFLKEVTPFLEAQSWYQNIQMMFPTWKLEVAFIGKDHAHAESVTITGYVEHPTETEVDETGNGQVRPKRYVLDFFLRTAEGNYPEVYDNYWKDWKQIFEAKLNMGRSKDLNDLIYFQPFKDDKYKFTNKGFRYFTFDDSNRKPTQRNNLDYQVAPGDVNSEQNNNLLLQLEDSSRATPASPQTIERVKKLMRKIGISLVDLETYLKGNPDVNAKGANALADLYRGIIAISEGKENVALTEEMVHIATAILQQTHPEIVSEMIAGINKFNIYKETLELYKDNPNYQDSKGKPNIRKIKKEAADKLISEIIINKFEGNEYYPEMTKPENRNIFKRLWTKILSYLNMDYKKANINIFERAGDIIMNEDFGTIADMNALPGDVFLQYTDIQKDFQRRFAETNRTIHRRENIVDKNAPDGLNMEEADNWYEFLKPDGSFEKITNRVTDRVKKFYEDIFGNKVFTEQEKILNEFKRTNGTKFHGFIEDIHDRFFMPDGTRRSETKKIPSQGNDIDDKIYSMLSKYFLDLIKLHSKDGNIPLVFSEQKLFDSKLKEAGTVDLIIIDSDGKAHIYDWKFMSVGASSKDVAWYKQGAYNVQLERYKEMLQDHYGIKSFGKNRAVPILFDIAKSTSPLSENLYYIKGINIGSADATQITDLNLMPVTARSEETGFDNLDSILTDLNNVYESISNKQTNTESERDFKRERLNIIKRAVRVIQSTLDVSPLVEVISVMKKEGDNIMMEYEADFKDQDINDPKFTEKKLSDFSDSLREYLAISEVFGLIGDTVTELIYVEGSEDNATSNEERETILFKKKIVRQIEKQSKDIRANNKVIRRVSNEFADNFMGLRNLVTGLTSVEKDLKSIGSIFRSVSDLSNAALNVLFKVVTNAKSIAAKSAFNEVNTLTKLKDNLSKRGGNFRDVLKPLFQVNSKGERINKLINKYDRKFYEGLDNNALEGARSLNYIKKNIDYAAYTVAVEAHLAERLKHFEKMYEDEMLIEKLYYEEQLKYDLTYPNFTGFDNFLLKQHPAQHWISKEYQSIEKDADLFALYEFITKINARANEYGYIENKVRNSFLPFVRRGFAETIAWDFSLSAITKLGNDLTIREDDVGYGTVDAVTKELVNTVPKYYTSDFTLVSREQFEINLKEFKRKNGRDPSEEETRELRRDNSEVSEDLFKNLALYITHLERYKYLSDVEGQLTLVQNIEKYKKSYESTITGDVVMDGEKGKTKEGNTVNYKIYTDFLNAMLYGHKYPVSNNDIPLNIGKALGYGKKLITNLTGYKFKENVNPTATSMMKAIDTGNRYFQTKTLGLSILAGAANSFGNAIQINTQSGVYFKAREFTRNLASLALFRFSSDSDRETFIALVNEFMPLKDDPSYESIKKLGMTELTKHNYTDMIFVFMRTPELLTEKTIFLTLLQNTMVDENGKMVNIGEYVKAKYPGRNKSAAEYRATKELIKQEVAELKATKSIEKVSKLENGKLTIPGLDMSNQKELQRLTNLTRRLARNATGSMADSDINRISLNIWGKSAMVFKGWIPKLVDTRFGEFRKTSDDFSVTLTDDNLTTGDKYDIGRIRLLTYVLGTSIRDSSANLTNILRFNDKGILAIDKMYEDFAAKHMKRTGTKLLIDPDTGNYLNFISKDDFVDLIRTNLRNQIKEIIIGLSLMSISFAVPPPDEEMSAADKNMYRYFQKVIDRFKSELMFFYNPAEFGNMLSGSMLPVLGIAGDVDKFVRHFLMEVTGMDISDPEKTKDEVMRDALPTKYAARMVPLTKELLNWIALFDDDFVKEYKIRVQTFN